MSAGSNQRSEDQFLCSICLDVFTDPVSTPCGHNFCRTCINEHWDADHRHQCPICKETFYPKPELKVNTLIAELADELRRSARDAGPQQQAAKPQGVPPDVGTGTSRKSWIFWLMGACIFFAVMMDDLQRELQTFSSYLTSRELLKTEAEINQLIQESQLKMAEIKLSVERSKEDAERLIAEADQAVTTLRESLERGHAELIDTIKERQRASEMKAEGFTKELEQFIRRLKKRRMEVEQISAARLEQMLAEEMKKEFPKVLARAELQRVQRYAVEVTLDPDTAHPSLILSDDGKQVSLGKRKDLPDNPKRFSDCIVVLGKQSFSSGRFYFEVQVKGKTMWDVGVAKESIDRKGEVILTPQNGYWTIWLRDGKYKAHASPVVDLSLQSPPEKVGVFVDYDEGLVSFYDVDSAALIYSFTGCSITEKLYPFFTPGTNEDGKNSAPLIITSVKH